MAILNSGDNTALATREDIKSIFSGIDTQKALVILGLRPTIADLEEASLWLGGDADVFGPGAPIKGTVSQIVTILTENEEDESRAR